MFVGYSRMTAMVMIPFAMLFWLISFWIYILIAACFICKLNFIGQVVAFASSFSGEYLLLEHWKEIIAFFFPWMLT